MENVEAYAKGCIQFCLNKAILKSCKSFENAFHLTHAEVLYIFSSVLSYFFMCTKQPLSYLAVIHMSIYYLTFMFKLKVFKATYASIEMWLYTLHSIVVIYVVI